MSGIPLDLGSNPATFHQAWSGFYKKPIKERRSQLSALLALLWAQPSKPVVESLSGARENRRHQSHHRDIKRDPLFSEGRESESVSPAICVDVPPLEKLDDACADRMIENYIGMLSLPVGLGLNFTINNEPIIIPMCVEESSVIAATSGAAKTIGGHGGFTCTSSERNLVGSQIQLLINKKDIPKAMSILEAKRSDIINKANSLCRSMVQRGGGVVSVTFDEISFAGPDVESLGVKYLIGEDATDPGSWIIVTLNVDTCEAMGANCASGLAEGIAPYLSELTGAVPGVRITSNFTPERFSTSAFCLPVDALAYKKFSGKHLARMIIEANVWSLHDISRAATHNKGLMNGIDAVALATGQDWRAIEAACHAYATKKDSKSAYAPLTDYWVDTDNRACLFKDRSTDKVVNQPQTLYFHGSLSLPLHTGTKGGALSMNMAYSSCMKIMGTNMTSKKLSQIMVTVGLAQNFAALRALCTDGIQKGHMSLHAHNIAIQAGVPVDKIDACVGYMKSKGTISVAKAKEFYLKN